MKRFDAKTPRKASSGQMIVVVPLTIALAVMGMLMWGYVENQRKQFNFSRAYVDGEKVAGSILRRAVKMLQKPLKGIADTDPCASVATRLITFWDYSTPPNPYTIQFDRSGSATTWTPSTGEQDWMKCLVSSEELEQLKSQNGSLNKLSITMVQTGTSDLATFSSTVSVTLDATTRSRPSQNDPIHQIRMQEITPLRVSSLSQYGVVLRDGGPKPQISPSPQSKVRFQGRVFLAGKAEKSLDQLISLPPSGVVFEKFVEFQTSKLTTPSLPVALEEYRSVFSEGIRLGVFQSVAKLPIEDGINPDGSDNWQEAWNHDLHWKEFNPTPGRFAMPRVTGAPGTNPRAVFPDYTPYNGTTTQAPFNTCSTRGSNKVPYAMVYLSMNGNFTIDFNSDGGFNKFCGLIAADTVTIKLKDDNSNHFVIGQIIAKQINVSGAGTLSLINPVDAVQISEVPDMDEIFAQIQMLAAGPGRNFFVPVFTTIPSGEIFFPFRPHVAWIRQSGPSSAPAEYVNLDATPKVLPVGYVYRSTGDVYKIHPKVAPIPSAYRKKLFE